MSSVDFSRLHPSLVPWLTAFNASPLATADPASVPIADRRVTALRNHLFNGGELIATRRIEDVALPMRDGTALPARLYLPRLVAAGERPLPVLLYAHGGGWVVGSTSSHDPLCRHLALHTQCAVLSIAYRLAPEHPAPQCVHDFLDSYAYVASDEGSAALGVDGTRILVGGDSSGGNIAAAAALQLAAGAGAGAGAGSAPPSPRRLLPLLQVLIYPTLDMTLSSGPSYTAYAEGYYLRTKGMEWYCGVYLSGSGLDPKDILVSPLFAAPELVAALPPAYIMTAGHDPLLSDGEAYRDLLRANGVPVTHANFEDMIHSCVCMRQVIGARVDEIYASIGAAVAARLAEVA
jgi:acetyl esterase